MQRIEGRDRVFHRACPQASQAVPHHPRRQSRRNHQDRRLARRQRGSSGQSPDESRHVRGGGPTQAPAGLVPSEDLCWGLRANLLLSAISDAVPDLTPQPSEPVRDTPGQVPIVHLEGRPARGRGVGEWRAGALGLHLWECRREPRGVPIETCRPEGGELDGGSCGSVERRSEGPEAGGVSGASTPSLVAHREDRRDERALGETGVRNHWRHGSRSCRSTPPVVIFGMEPER